MQTEVPTLPVVHFNAYKNLNRKQNSNLGRPSVETKVNSSDKNVAYFSSKKKNLHPLLGQPYQSNVQHHSSLEQSKLKKNSIEQGVVSAKMLRIKELQNQLADAHYQLNELANENKLLKALQKRQDSALKRYEGTNAELPRIINSHHEELRVLQTKYKRLKTLQKETCDLLKEKQNELQHKDRNLGEREKLQLEVSDLNHRIQQQQDTIQTLHKKLALETKSLKQQLHLEISKRKETQKYLNEKTEKLKTLENLLDNRERRLYYSGQLLLPDKNRRFGTQSLTNLRDISSSNPLKLSDKNKKWQTDVQKYSLPLLHTSELNDKNIKIGEMINPNQTADCTKSETMTNLEQVRRYRLQKSPYKNMLNNPEEQSKELDSPINENSKQLEQQQKEIQKYQISGNKFRKMYNNRKYHNFNKLLEKELVDSSEDSESENENENDKDNYVNVSSNSKQLHTSADDTSDSKELRFPNCKYRDKLKVLVKERENSYGSDSELESEIRKQPLKQYLSMNHQNDTLHLISSVCNNQIHYDSDKEIEKLTTSSKNILNGSQNLYQNLIDDVHMQAKNVEEQNIYAQYDIKSIEMDYKNSENIENYVFEQNASEVQEYSNESITKDDPKSESLLQTYSKPEHNILFTTNNIKSVDITSEISHINDSIINDSQRKSSTKNLLNFSKNLDKTTTNRADTTEIGITSKNIFLQNYNLETKNKLNKQELDKKLESIDMVSYDVQSLDNNLVRDILTDVSTTTENNVKTKITNYNKEKLLASMKAIDDNENIEFLNPEYEKHGVIVKKQITENVYYDLPSHMKKKQDIIKDIFDTDVIKNESTDSCNKLRENVNEQEEY
ncbi:Lebercilin-like protein [Eufriesea mexicana]|nr:Lebercilin-like protein [Eufriesea mexicana]